MKKPNYRGVIAGVRIFETIAASRSSASLITITMNILEEQCLFKEPSSPIGRTQSGLAASFVTPSNGEHTLIPVMTKMIYSAVWKCEMFVLKDGQLL
jgi:hypothetical protein